MLAHLLENSLGHTKSSKQKRSNGRVNGPTNQATYHSSGEASGLKSGGSVGNALGIDVKAPGVRTPAAPVTTAAVQPVKNNVGPANERNDGDAKKEATFTAEQDAKILEMKNDKSTWNEIVQAIGGHSKSDIQARFKKLNAEKGPSSGNEAGKINTTETEAAKDNEARKKVQSQEPKDRANSVSKRQEHTIFISKCVLTMGREPSKAYRPHFLALIKLPWIRLLQSER